MTTSNSIRVKPIELFLVDWIRVLMISTKEKVFWKIFSNFRIGHWSKTYATSGDQINPIDIINKTGVCLVRAGQFVGFPLKKNETVVKKFDSFLFPKKTRWYLLVGVEGEGIEPLNYIRKQ